MALLLPKLPKSKNGGAKHSSRPGPTTGEPAGRNTANQAGAHSPSMLDTSESTQSDQSKWLVADLNPEERKFEVPDLTDATPIVRYVRLSTLFLYLSDRAFIPSLECLRGLDRKEAQADFEYSDEARFALSTNSEINCSKYGDSCKD